MKLCILGVEDYTSIKISVVLLPKHEPTKENNSKHATVERASALDKKSRQFKKAENGRNSLHRKAHKWLSNTKHTCQEHYRGRAGSICPLRNMYTETYMYVKTIKEKERMKLKEYGRFYAEFGGRNRGEK